MNAPSMVTLQAVRRIEGADPKGAASPIRRQIIELHVEHCPPCALIGDCGWIQREKRRQAEAG